MRKSGGSGQDVAKGSASQCGCDEAAQPRDFLHLECLFSDVSFNLLILSILSYSCRICFPTFWVSCRRARNPGNCCANAAGQSRRRICFYKKNTDVFLVAIKLFWGRVFSRTCDCIVFISWRLFCHRCPSPSAARCREGPLIEACLRH